MDGPYSILSSAKQPYRRKRRMEFLVNSNRKHRLTLLTRGEAKARIAMLKFRLNVTIKSTIRTITLLCLFLAICSTVGLGQETPNPQRGFYPGGSYAVSNIESI